ncbi:secretory carrier-associated membrane protein 3 isoform X3 [Rhineura floridana]|uniref:secretory carrier-associated membrane protein 3 isoform X3 n=1 Tax=Rhineura floridana TaxID=261503 RepID=UPI002AC8215F|nr:secretory carrier-associated membrane protein 3 isoform X3 [Rhineura floridana]
MSIILLTAQGFSVKPGSLFPLRRTGNLRPSCSLLDSSSYQPQPIMPVDLLRTKQMLCRSPSVRAPSLSSDSPTAATPCLPAHQEAKPHRAQELRLLWHSGVSCRSHRRSVKTARRAEPQSHGVGPPGARTAERGFGPRSSPSEQLAAVAVLLPCEALLLSGYPRGDPRGVAENRHCHVLPLDGQHCDPLLQLPGIAGLVLCGRHGRLRLWPFHPVGLAVCTLLLPLLVSPPVQGLQERQLFQLLRLLLHLLCTGCGLCSPGHWHPRLGVQWLDPELQSTEEEHRSGYPHAAGGLPLHGYRRAGHPHAEANPLPLPSHGRQLPESAGRVRHRRFLQSSGAHGGCQCSHRGGKWRFPALVRRRAHARAQLC